MKVIPIASAIALMLPSGVAFAADPNDPIDQMSSSTWSGPYIGLLGGVSLRHFNIFEPNIVAGVTSNDWAPTLGAFAGNNWQSGDIVYGVEGEIGYRFGNHTVNGVPGAATVIVSTGLYGKLKGRVGRDMGTWMPFLTAGVTASELNTNAVFFAQRNGTVFGGVVGAGVDVALGNNMFLRGAYEFSYFGKKTFEYCGGPCVLQHQVQTHDFVIGIAKRF